eukprot:TRINITY_DN70197_c0_g1_i1.p1 TRINITY_DN70197_c0_g1~~TRINITY_DN70197_c0_g1_i1.p1  ORF type:complete len:373 (+),score=61.78 TRINITY_DN70197_c0_g1_i1:84-1202(+)
MIRRTGLLLQAVLLICTCAGSGDIHGELRHAESVDKLDLLYSLGCRVPGYVRPDHGAEKVSKEYKALAVQMVEWRKLRNARVEAEKLSSDLETGVFDSELTSDVRLRNFLDAFGAVPALRQECEAALHEGRGVSAVRSILNLAASSAVQPLASAIERTLHSIEITMQTMPVTVQIVNTTGQIWKISRYQGRSCANAEGMWQENTKEIALRKMRKVADTLGMAPESSVLYLAAGCGHHLAAFEERGAKVFGQELMQHNLDHLQALWPSSPFCGGEASHFLASLPNGTFDYIVANAILTDSGLSMEARCHLFTNALRVARFGVYIGWVEFDASEWKHCGHGNMFTVNEKSFFGEVEYNLARHQLFHSVFANPSG